MPRTDDFERQTAPYRRELLAHCYQMLGSVHDAEDLVQDTLLRAWRAYDRYDERRASMRTWLHRIATNACLTALDGRRRRPLPSGVVAASDDPRAPLVPGAEPAWLEPIPDSLLSGDAGDPAAVVLARGRLRLALIAGMQLLPARQRAILILREVLEWSAAEVAVALGTTPAAVNSGLQRARARLRETGVGEDGVREPSSAERRAHVDRYVDAFVGTDLAALASLLTDDVVLEMPPVAVWYRGPADYVAFIARALELRGTDWRMRPVAANGQPAVAAYTRVDGAYARHSLQVFDVVAAGIRRAVVFTEAATLDAFGIPAELAPGR
ncbi:sigma-70 family RNA polymerase sigma factor [Cellulomonas edaphi]|uniref:RNA polymerase sigma factor n=1 Tax=Cellulomonas edaphi TaxID=3053468 RepID=A0ABT7S3Z0_9CELL|nr:sigma-70 family RNA polymerase sigma factor [Cellulomons edaphi]MDM7830330.1 sigma-70 family RNA polymerase sigma factor [Cellulomons edaphi]